MKRLLLCALVLLAAGCQSGPQTDRLTGVWADDQGNVVEFIPPNGVLWMKEFETVRGGNIDGERYEEKFVSRSVQLGLYHLDGDQAEIQWARRRSRRGEERRILKLGPEGAQTLKFEAHPEPEGKVQSFELNRVPSQIPPELVGIWKNSAGGRIEGRILSAGGVNLDIGKFGGSRKGGRASRAKQYEVNDQTLVIKDLNFNYRHHKAEEVRWMMQGEELKFLGPWELKKNKSFSELKPFTRQLEPLRFTQDGRVQWSAEKGE